MANKKGSKKINKIKIELTPLSLFLWSIFLLFLLAWVFVLGILVERDILPDIGNPFKKIGKTVGQKEEYEEPKKDPVFNFYDNLESKKNEVKRRSIPRKEKEPDQEITLSRNETADSSESLKSAEPDKKEQIKPLTKAALQDYFSVQIAAVSIPERAQKLVKELVDQDYDAYYYSATINGKTTYRIMSGRFSKRSDAVLCLKKLKNDTGYKGFIVKFGK